MYGITDKTKEVNVTGTQPIPTGINEPVFLESVVFEPLKEDKPPTLQYNYKDEAGRTLRHVMWEIDTDRVKRNAEDYPKEHRIDDPEHGFVKGRIISPEDAVIIASKDFNSFNLHILNRFVDSEAVALAQKDVDSYDSFARSVVDILEPIDTMKVPLRLKVVLDYNQQYHVLPKYPPFVENVDEVPKEKSRLIINPKYDKLVPEKVSEEVPEEFSNSEGFDDMDNEASF